MLQKIKNEMRKNEKVYSFVMKLYDALPNTFKIQRNEEYKMGGGYTDLKFFVLRRIPCENGIASNLLVFLGQLKYMEKQYKGYQPIVDMQNYPQLMSETTGEAGNAWEDFFVQPNGQNYGMADVSKGSKTVLACPYYNYYEYPNQLTFCDLAKKGWDYYFKKYIVLRDDLQKTFLDDWNNLRNSFNKGKIIGVKVRGTDYTMLKPKGHSVQPTVEQVIERIKEFFAKRPDYQSVFVATEDRKICDEIEKAFPNRVFFLKCKRINYTDGGILYSKNVGELSRKKITEEYLEEMYLLAKCDSLICGNTSSLVPTLLWNEGRYEEVYVFDLGVYS